jgi:hypothetical protein
MSKPSIANMPIGKGVISDSSREKDIEEVTQIISDALTQYLHDINLDTEISVTFTAKQLFIILYELRWYTWSDNDIAILRARLNGLRELVNTSSANTQKGKEDGK